ncbi:MAG: cation transporter [Actinomycetota bacterium]|jgi:multisubunit Na+/H+ antiporter MnhB subunit|nr:cation transporter [Actinomycetota bacterium]
MERVLVLDRSVRVVFHLVLIGSLYLLFAGHNQPGGGFVGGLVAGAAMATRYVAGGIAEVRGLTRFAPWTILGSGLVLSVSTAIIPILFGREVLQASVLTWDGPVLGKVKVTTALPFDVGVYLLVVGLVLMIFEAFGDDPPSPDELVEDRS